VDLRVATTTFSYLLAITMRVVTAYASQSSHHCCTCISRAISVVHYLLRIAPIIGSPVKGGVNHPSILYAIKTFIRPHP